MIGIIIKKDELLPWFWGDNYINKVFTVIGEGSNRDPNNQGDIYFEIKCDYYIVSGVNRFNGFGVRKECMKIIKNSIFERL